MASIDKVVLEIKQAHMNPRYRPADIIWTLTPADCDDFPDIMEAFLAQTTINGRCKLAQLIALKEAGDEKAVAAVFDHDVSAADGEAQHYLTLSSNGQTKLDLFLNTCELSEHYSSVFKDKLISFGNKRTEGGPIDLEEVKPDDIQADEITPDISRAPEVSDIPRPPDPQSP